MPKYDFKCPTRELLIEDKILSIHHTEDDRPECCGKAMPIHISTPPLVHWTDPVIEPFRNPAAKRGDKDAVITSQKQRREFMEKNDLVDANDLIPPSHEEQKREVAEMQKSVDAITPTKEMADAIPDIV